MTEKTLNELEAGDYLKIYDKDSDDTFYLMVIAEIPTFIPSFVLSTKYNICEDIQHALQNNCIRIDWLPLTRSELLKMNYSHHYYLPNSKNKNPSLSFDDIQEGDFIRYVINEDDVGACAKILCRINNNVLLSKCNPINHKDFDENISFFNCAGSWATLDELKKVEFYVYKKGTSND